MSDFDGHPLIQMSVFDIHSLSHIPEIDAILGGHSFFTFLGGRGGGGLPGSVYCTAEGGPD